MARTKEADKGKEKKSTISKPSPTASKPKKKIVKPIPGTQGPSHEASAGDNSIPMSSKPAKRPRKAVESSASSEDDPLDPPFEEEPPRPSKKQKSKAPAAPREPAPSLALALPPAPLIEPTGPTHYPFGEELSFTNAKHTENLAVITKASKLPMVTVYPDMSTLETVEISDEVHSRLSHSGLDILFDDDPGMYPKLVREFICSFEAVRSNSKKITHWKFVLGGCQKRFPKATICEWLRFPLNGVSVPKYSDFEMYNFWHKISSRDEWFASGFNSNSIKDKVWKVIHRFIALGINVRTDGARMVTIPDLNIMLAIDNGLTLDWFSILAARFEEYMKPTSQVTALGGGSFVTHLALRCNFTFEHEGCPLPEKKTLNMEALRVMSLIEADGKTWTHSTAPHKKPLRKTARNKKNKYLLQRKALGTCLAMDFSLSSQSSDDSSAAPSHEPSIHSQPPPKRVSPSDRLETISTDLEHLKTYVHEHVRNLEEFVLENSRWVATGAESSMLKGKKLAKCKNKAKVNACAKDHGVEAAESSKMREIKNKNGKKSRKVDFSGEEPAKSAKGKVDKPNKRGKKRKHSSCAENPEESLKMKAKSKTLYEDDEEMEVVDISLDADTSMMGSLIRGNSELHIPFEGIESRRQAMKEQGWERAVVEDGDSEIQEVQEDDGGSEDMHDRSTEGVQAPSFDKVGVVQPGGDVQSVEVEVEVNVISRGMEVGEDVQSGGMKVGGWEVHFIRTKDEIACNQGRITGHDDKDSCEPHYQDTDTEGVDLQLKFMTCSGRSTYAVVIDNLEKDLTPLTATNFILKETNINCQAYIFPSMLTDMYTRGVIEVNSREEFIEFNNFLESTHQIIVSSHNRPWVMTEWLLWQGEVRTIMPTSGGQQIHSARSLGELKVVRSGTPEYNMAKQLKENFIEFCSHGKRVIERLAWEEQRIKSRWAIN